jgi:ribosomal protein S18 acetylase RimI-like enzyme
MQQSIKICKASLSDLHDILDLQKKAYVQEAEIYNDYNIQPLIQDIDSLTIEWQKGVVLKAEANGKIVGSVRAVLVNDICRIGKLIVAPDFQNQGIGKRLMKEIESIFDNCLTYELFTGFKSVKNLSLYRKLGYKDFKEEAISNTFKLIYLQKQKSF